MAGFIITTNLDRRNALLTARDAARDLGFTVERTDEDAFEARQGNFALSLFLGAFIAYCNFTVAVDPGRYEGEVDITITRNSPWWTGIIGVNRVKKRAKELADAIADAIEEGGGKVLKERDF